MTRRRLLVVLVAAALAILLAGGAGFVSYVSWKSADSLVHPARLAPTLTPRDVGLSYQRVLFRATDGVDLVGWWMPASSPAGTVVFLHGYGDSKNQSLRYAPFLHNASFSVLAFDFRAHGESAGDHTTVGLDETQDVEGALQWLRERGDVDPSRVALMGLSMGGATAIRVAAQDPGVSAVVADSAFASLQNIASNSIQHFTGLPRYPYGPVAVTFAGWMVHRNVREDAPIASIRSVTAPVFLIQGGADDIARPADDGQALANAAPNATYWLVDGAYHVGAHSVATGEYEVRVATFLHESFGGVVAERGVK